MDLCFFCLLLSQLLHGTAHFLVPRPVINNGVITSDLDKAQKTMPGPELALGGAVAGCVAAAAHEQLGWLRAAMVATV
jgi:hypothetical protein